MYAVKTPQSFTGYIVNKWEISEYYHQSLSAARFIIS